MAYNSIVTIPPENKKKEKWIKCITNSDMNIIICKDRIVEHGNVIEPDQFPGMIKSNERRLDFYKEIFDEWNKNFN